MTLPKGFIQFHGKQNLMASFNHWLMDTIQGGYLGFGNLPVDKEFYWSFNYPIAPQQSPTISVVEQGLFNLGEQALGRLMGHSDGEPVYGTRNQTLIEITCLAADSEIRKDATNIVYGLRDRVVYAIQSNIDVAIPLKDYSNPSAPQIGIIELDPESNSINEKFLVDQQNQEVKRYVLLIRIFWFDLDNRTKSSDITSDAEIS